MTTIDMTSATKGLDMADKILEVTRNYHAILAAWVGLFILTLVFTELNMRSLAAAFCAWAGGLVTARLDSHFREKKERKASYAKS